MCVWRRQGARVPVHRVRAQRALQLRGDAAAGPQPRRAQARAAKGRLLALHHAQASALLRHPFRRQTFPCP
jgi:hypothetical protein